MSTSTLILIGSIVIYTIVNSHFMRTDETFRAQSYERKFLEDPLGIKRFKQQPKKMGLFAAILLAPISLYYLFQTLSAG